MREKKSCFIYWYSCFNNKWCRILYWQNENLKKIN